MKHYPLAAVDIMRALFLYDGLPAENRLKRIGEMYARKGYRPKTLLGKQHGKGWAVAIDAAVKSGLLKDTDRDAYTPTALGHRFVEDQKGLAH